MILQLVLEISVGQDEIWLIVSYLLKGLRLTFWYMNDNSIIYVFYMKIYLIKYNES